MKWLSRLMPGLDAGDRKLLLWCVGIALVLAIAAGILTPNNEDANRLPSSYLSGQHGALAAYETLLQSGYPLERWERPLGELAETAGPETVILFAQPMSRDIADIRAIRQILDRGGRVVATGFEGGFLLPRGTPAAPSDLTFAACKLEPNGLDALASTGEIWMVPQASWQLGNPTDRVQYTCAGKPAVVEFGWGKGHVVWWASSTPLENGSLSRAQNLDLLLNSLGPKAGHKFYWDESLHGEIRSVWTFAWGPSMTILCWSLPVLALLVIFSFSRRSGPLRALPLPARATPIEFIDALGSLYRGAGASSTAVAIAWERFRRQALALCGIRAPKMEAAELAIVLRRRFPLADEALEADLTACEQSAKEEALQPREALRLIQLLNAHWDKLKSAAGPQRAAVEHTIDNGVIHERAS
ncbi:DUF4350 domain-containing protein [Terracidiphilus gabretensis]|jgi:hypothetical protein|uniref:DUF4350 domain-containing protein n=1 Tax=Terracidiphilus gabretensis TaxID=1577687 RepID=UPI00071B116B|nr:DUF4350 domain-containing protein [Terracidiphilus gabretensis]